jgi:hypothetical protein
MKCHLCDCFHFGTVNNKKSCNLDNGQCECKQNVKNRQCNECRDGYCTEKVHLLLMLSLFYFKINSLIKGIYYLETVAKIVDAIR